MCVTSLACSPAWAALPSFDEIGRTVPGLRAAGWGGFAVADFDGDGHEDLAVPGVNGSGQIQIIGQTPAGIRVKQILILEGVGSQTLQAVVHGGRVKLFGLSGPTFTEYSGWPLARVRSLYLLGLSGLPAMAIGDIDADGTDDIVAVESSNGNFVRGFNLSTGAITWGVPNDQGRHVVLAQLDADPALEIIVSGFALSVIDGATKAVEWTYGGEYLACCLTGGRFANATDDAFAASGGTLANPLNVFRSSPYSIAWSQPLQSIGVLGAGDLDNDGIDELLEGDVTWGSMRVFDGRTGNERLVVPHSANGIEAVAAVDFSGDGAASIAFSSRGQFADSDDILRVVNSTNGTTQWELLNDRRGSYGLVATGDIDDDGRDELLLASGADNTDVSITQIDVATGAQQWRSPMHPPASSDFPYSFQPVFIGIAQRNGRPPAIVSGGGTGFGGRLVAVDGPTHAVVWDLRDFGGGVLSNIRVQQGKVYDFDSDGNDEIVLCTREAGSSIEAFGVAVFDGRNGALLWRTTGLGSNMDQFCNGILAGTFDDGQAPRIVALLAGSVEAIDAETHQIVWSLPIANASGTWLIESGQSGREFAVAQAGSVRFYDASSMTFLRQISVPAPVQAIREIDSSIHRLLVTSNGRLRVVDGISGDVSATSDYLGPTLGNRDHLFVRPEGGGSYLVVVGSDAGAFRLHLRVTDVIHADGFD